MMSHFYYALQDAQGQSVHRPAVETAAPWIVVFETNPASGSLPLKSRGHGRSRTRRASILRMGKA